MALTHPDHTVALNSSAASVLQPQTLVSTLWHSYSHHEGATLWHSYSPPWRRDTMSLLQPQSEGVTLWHYYSPPWRRDTMTLLQQHYEGETLWHFYECSGRWQYTGQLVLELPPVEWTRHWILISSTVGKTEQSDCFSVHKYFFLNNAQYF